MCIHVCMRLSLSLFLLPCFASVIYDPKAHDNERESAELWKLFAMESHITSTSSSSASLLQKIYEWIVCTATHLSTETERGSDLAYFLDFDLAVLGSSTDRYLEYASQIRREYSHIEEAAFCSGRSEVLRRFLKARRLYFTEILGGELEVRARLNLTAEIGRLQDKLHTHSLSLLSGVCVCRSSGG
jgi:predicted metal-dependent HD superfamily phosphohydrolase